MTSWHALDRLRSWPGLIVLATLLYCGVQLSQALANRVHKGIQASPLGVVGHGQEK